MAEYVTTVTDSNLREALTMYRLGEHSLAIEKGHRRQTRLSREDEEEPSYLTVDRYSPMKKIPSFPCTQSHSRTLMETTEKTELETEREDSRRKRGMREEEEQRQLRTENAGLD